MGEGVDVGKEWVEDTSHCVVSTLPLQSILHTAARGTLWSLYIRSYPFSDQNPPKASHLRELNSNFLSIPHSIDSTSGVCKCCFSGFISLLSTCHLMHSSCWSLHCFSSLLPPLGLCICSSLCLVHSFLQISSWLDPSSHFCLCSNLPHKETSSDENKQNSHPITFNPLYVYVWCLSFTNWQNNIYIDMFTVGHSH